MKYFVTKNGYKITTVLRGRSNAYVIQTPSEVFLVDTGSAKQRNRLMQNLKLARIDHVDQLILTHSHFDHCQNAYFLKEHFNLKINGHEKSLDWVRNGFTPFPKGVLLFSKWIAKLGNAIGDRINRFEPFTPDHIICDGTESLHFADGIEIIPTPGHSTDSISLVVNNEVALVGDTLFGIFKNSVMPPFADDPLQLLRSWKLLCQTHSTVFLPGHGRFISRNLLQSQIKKYSEL